MVLNKHFYVTAVRISIETESWLNSLAFNVHMRFQYYTSPVKTDRLLHVCLMLMIRQYSTI